MARHYEVLGGMILVLGIPLAALFLREPEPHFYKKTQYVVAF
ncbi:MAG: hypothetical protein ACRD22_13355 [Terriglobia bacterium]